jgi:hypothetical protein
MVRFCQKFTKSNFNALGKNVQRELLDIHCNVKTTDIGFMPLADITTLTHLSLIQTSVKTSLQSFTKLVELKHLCLKEADPVTDQDIAPLTKLTQLTQLDLWHTHVTQEMMNKLQKLIPSLKITTPLSVLLECCPCPALQKFP